MGAREAEAHGLVTSVVPSEATVPAALELAARIAAMPPVAVIAAKAAVNRAEELPLEAGLEFERRSFYLLFDTEDQAEGMAAFAEKRTPTLEGPLMSIGPGDEPAPAGATRARQPRADRRERAGQRPRRPRRRLACVRRSTTAAAAGTSSRPPPRHARTMLAEIDADALAQRGPEEARPAADRPRPGGPRRRLRRSASRAYDVLVNADHLLAWGIGAEALRETAMANLARLVRRRRRGPTSCPATRRLLSSDTGEGGDAARILLPEVRAHLAGECGGPARVLVGAARTGTCSSPARCSPATREFAGQFAAFVADVADGAHEPIDGGLFELVGERATSLVPAVRAAAVTPGAPASTPSRRSSSSVDAEARRRDDHAQPAGGAELR